MTRENFNDLHLFAVVARERSFTKAAAQLGVSRSALSHTMLALETRLGVRLLTRTTRSVSTTDAGARLLETVGPRLQEIEEELTAVRATRDKPVGVVRITAHDHAIRSALWPRLMPLLKKHPELSIEFSVDYALTDIAAQRFDAGVRVGNRVDKDMVAVQIAAPMRMAVVASPQYLSDKPAPVEPGDLTEHLCINLRLATHGGLYAWDFEKDGQSLNVRVRGQAVFNNTFLMVEAAIDGMGFAFVPRDIVETHLSEGRLVTVLDDWCPTFPGYHMYYANRRHLPAALALVVKALASR